MGRVFGKLVSRLIVLWTFLGKLYPPLSFEAESLVVVVLSGDLISPFLLEDSAVACAELRRE